MAVWHWFGRGRERDFDEELASHFRLAVEERIAAGEDPETARRAARREFGNVTRTREASRRVWRGAIGEWLIDLGQDVRYATRLLRRSPGYAAVVILVLALGIGATVSVFGLANAAFLRPLPGVDDSHELTVVVARGAPDDRIVTLSYPDYRFLRAQDEAFQGLVAMSPRSFSLGFGNTGERVWGELVSDNYFEVLGVEARLGRTLVASDDPLRGGSPAVVISDGLWRRSFGTDPNVVGRTVRINGNPFTVAGVAEAGFVGSMVAVRNDIFLPLTTLSAPEQVEALDNRWLVVMGRLAPGTSLDTAAARTEVLAAALAQGDPLPAISRRAEVLPFWQSPFGGQTFLLPVVAVLGAMGGLVLLVVCANLANLVMARGVGRLGEIAVRVALGASRARIVRLLLLENLVLAIPAAVAGVGVAALLATVDTSGAAVATVAPSELNTALGGRGIGFAVVVACVSAILFGFLPAWRTSRVPPATVMKEEGTALGYGRQRFRGVLVVAQVAMAVVLMVAAGLTTRTVRAAQEAEVGFDPTDTVSVTVDVQLNDYDRAQGYEFFEQLLDRVRALPGVEGAGLALFAPLRMVEGGSLDVVVDGYPADPDEDMRLAFNVVSPEYFRTMRIALVAGREFERRDAADGAPVVIVNETMARRFWRTPQDAVGRQIRVGNDDERWRTVIGVARDIKYQTLTERPMSYFYRPLAQAPRGEMMAHVRGTLPPETLIAQVRGEVSALDPNLPIIEAETLAAQARVGTFLYEQVARGLALFGGLAMALAAVGLYGLVAYTVRRRAHEIGIRMALGARRVDVVRQVLRSGLTLGAVGALAGLGLALLVTRLMAAVLFGVSPTDPAALGGALAVVLGVALLASFLPAWRAVRGNPIATLHHH
jgi:predicted permease